MVPPRGYVDDFGAEHGDVNWDDHGDSVVV